MQPALPIYLDHAATTPVLPAVWEAMQPYYMDFYGNPSALHQIGQAARAGVDAARELLAEGLNADPDEIIFTSGGTEADNLAIFGTARASQGRGRHILTTPIEHHAVLEPFETLRGEGFEVEYLPVDATGLVSLAEVACRLRSDTTLVSVMHANNEIGTIQPIAELGALCRAHGVRFHTDAVQTFGHLPLDVRKMSVDLLSVSAHKFHGPKGVGLLYARKGTPLTRFQQGGGQERGRRGGTLNVPAIVGMGKAAEIAFSDLEAESARLIGLRDGFINRLLSSISNVRVTGHRTQRLPNNIHICIGGVEGEPLLLAMDAAGLCVSAASACSAGSFEPSHVLKAIGLDRDLSRGALRLTLGRATTPESLDYALATLERVVRDLRDLSREPQNLPTYREPLAYTSVEAVNA